MKKSELDKLKNLRVNVSSQTGNQSNEKLLYIFDYDDTLKSENGMCPNKQIFIDLVEAVKRETGLPIIILTSGYARSYERIYSMNRRTVRPVDFVRLVGLKYIENEFDINADVCIFDVNFNNLKLRKEFGHPLIDSVGRKNLASLNFIIYSKYDFSPNMILFDDLAIHSIDSKNTKIGILDPFIHSKVMYLQVKKLGKLEKDSCERLKIYTKVVETASIDRCNEVFTILKFRGSELLLRVI